MERKDKPQQRLESTSLSFTNPTGNAIGKSRNRLLRRKAGAHAGAAAFTGLVLLTRLSSAGDAAKSLRYKYLMPARLRGTKII